jgi:hypothetical protein
VKEKIVIFTDFPIFSNYGGGITTAMNNIALLLNMNYEIINISKNYSKDKIYCGFIKYYKYNSIVNLISIVKSIKPNYIYINGLFSFYSSILPTLIFSNNKEYKFIISPRGMLKITALKNKFIIKKSIIFLFKFLSKRIIFHATDSRELDETLKHFKNSNTILIPDLFPEQSKFNLKEKKCGSLNILFASRVDSIKNLRFVLDTLLNLKYIDFSLINLTIVGSNDDKKYWNSCMNTMNNLTNKGYNIEYLGHLNNKELLEIMDKSHLLYLPTKGENFGYVIAESLSRSLPVLISDQTYFNLNYDLESIMIYSINDTIEFENSILKYIQLDTIDFNQISKKLYDSYESIFKTDLIKSQYLQLFK